MSNNKDGPDLCPNCCHGRWTLAHAVCVAGAFHNASLGTPECQCHKCVEAREDSDAYEAAGWTTEWTQSYDSIEKRQDEERRIKAAEDRIKERRSVPRGKWTRAMVNPTRY